LTFSSVFDLTIQSVVLREYLLTSNLKTGQLTREPPDLSGRQMSESEAPRMLYPTSTIVIILSRVARGESLFSITQEPGMPSRQSWARWCAADDELAQKYLRAQQQGLEARFHAA
jgi:hypothetical protein